MEGSTIATSTARFEELDRSPSPTPSNSSIYFDCDEESELPTTSASKDAQREPPTSPSNRTAVAVEAALDVESLVSSSKPTTSIAQDTEQESVSQSIIPPSTPSTLSSSSSQRIFDQLDISPSSSSDRSNFSSSTLVDRDPDSPITQKSASPSREPLHQAGLPKLQPAKPTSNKKLPCLQCQLSNLSCSFSVPPPYRRMHLQPRTELRCTRCARNGESLCILQVAVQKEAADQDRFQTWGRKLGEVEGECTFFAGGVEGEVASEKAADMLEAKKENDEVCIACLECSEEKFEACIWRTVRGGRGGWRKV